MIKKRLVNLLEKNLIYVKKTIAYNWIALVMNIIFIFSIAQIFNQARLRSLSMEATIPLIIGCLVAFIVRFFVQRISVMSSYQASIGVKQTLRENIYKKLLSLGTSYQEHMSTAEVVQVTMEGVEQLEIYFGKYLPQLFYSLLAPLTLFMVLLFINVKVAVVLFIFVPLIPISIVVVQKIAKRILNKYWTSYTELGDSFLENLQGLTTLKIYQADAIKTKQMDQEAEHFRKVTMRVLTMQLNSISVMDLVAFGGAAAGILLAVFEFRAGQIDVAGMIIIILLSSEFFIPLRLLGSFFHIAMNGMAASDKIFKILDLEIDNQRDLEVSEEDLPIIFDKVQFSYTEERQILQDIEIKIPRHTCIALVGRSGCGKSTIANILTGYQSGYEGSIRWHDKEMSKVKEDSIFNMMTLVNHDGYIFAGTVAYNLQIVSSSITEEQMWDALHKVKLDAFVKEQGGLSMKVLEQGSNLSGGQKQRLVLARSLLKNTPIYIFDEATSNIDVESENTIMEVIYQLKETKTLILISHRLDTVKDADQIYMMETGRIVEQGTHKELYIKNGPYAKMYQQQEALLSITKEDVNNEA